MWWLCWAATALAADSAVDVRTALASGDVRAARAALSELDTSLGRSRTEVTADQLAFRYQAQGAVFDLQSRRATCTRRFECLDCGADRACRPGCPHPARPGGVF